ncbi:MAG: bifunctional nuclease domain-containing protein, partial [Chloroflexota bacterium]
QRIVVTNLESDTFFAKIVLKTDGGETEIDCRPSDAIALAVRGGQVVLGADGQDHWFESFEEAQRYRDESGVDSNSPEYAVRSGIPIFVEESVLQVAGVRLDGDDQVSIEQVEPKRTAPPATEISADELTSMSAFSEFLKELPGLEELGEDSKD